MVPGIPSLGGVEPLIIPVIILLFLGARRLPEMGRSLGRSIQDFKEGLNTKEQPEEEKESEAVERQEKEPY